MRSLCWEKQVVRLSGLQILRHFADANFGPAPLWVLPARQICNSMPVIHLSGGPWPSADKNRGPPISINRRRGRLRASFICDRGRRCSGIGEGSVFRAAVSWFDLSADVHSRGWWHGNNPRNRETSCQGRGDVWRRRPDVDTTSRNARGVKRNVLDSVQTIIIACHIDAHAIGTP